MRRLFLPCSCLLLFCLLPVSLASAAAGAIDPDARGLLRHIGELDRELQGRLGALARAARSHAGQNAAGPGAVAPARRLESLDRELRDLRRAVLALDADAQAPLLAKTEALGHLLHNLRTAAARPEPTLPHSERSRQSRLLPPTAVAAPANDACAAAQALGFGTVAGDLTLATHDGQASCGSSLYAADLWYRFVAPQSGWVSADTFGSGMDTVLSVHSGCPGTLANEQICSDDAYGLQSAVGFFAYEGETYYLRVSGYGGETGSFLLTAGHGGTLSGEVRAASSGQPLADVYVDLRSPEGYFVQGTTSGSDGSYALTGVSAGPHFLTTENGHGYLDELFDDHPCPNGGYFCDLAPGDAVAVGSNGTLTGLDFDLDRGGVISGRLTDETSGQPIASTAVYALDASGFTVAYGSTDTAGHYELVSLPAGSYFVRTDSSLYRDEVWNDVPCPGWSCSLAGATPVAVAINQTSGGIDFALQLLGAISGTVSEAGTGVPLASARVEIYSATNYVSSVYTDSAGHYTLGGLAAGAYVAIAGSFGFSPELYAEKPCPGGFWDGCTFAQGTPIAVTFGQASSGIDFTLDRLGSLRGTVVRARDGAPLPSIEVDVFHSDGGWAGYTWTGAAGAYEVLALPAGTYLAETYNYMGYIDEVYRELPCSGSGSQGCPLASGTPIAVSLGTATHGIDFTLATAGQVAGRVTRAATGAPVAAAVVQLWNSAGQEVSWAYTDESGQYLASGLAAGTYFATTHNNSGLLDELYDDRPCAFGGCVVTNGTPIAATLDHTTTGIDFALAAGGEITGTVRDATSGDPVPYADVQLWSSSGSALLMTSADFDGTYSLAGLAAGTYYLTTAVSFWENYLDELYQDLPCPGGAGEGCDPTDGTPVVVTGGGSQNGIDFSLARKGSLSGTVRDATTGEPADARLSVIDADGYEIASDYTDIDGHYAVEGLPSGSYHVVARAFGEYVPEVYDNVPCWPNAYDCDLAQGTPVAVSLGADTPGIDFQLDRYGALSGVVTDATSGAAIPNVTVRAWDATGRQVAQGYTDESGQYEIPGLPPRTHYLTTTSDGGFIDELYDDRPCLGGQPPGCKPTKGTPIVVQAGVVRRHLDFTLLSLNSGIVGVALDGHTGAPLANVSVDVWDLSGNHLASAITRASGAYHLDLGAGTYYLSSDNGRGFVDEVFDDVPCPAGPAFGGFCDPLNGTPVVVGTASPVVGGVDFVLRADLFSDGFESGDLSAWSAVVGNH